jgi:heat shock protein HslJ
MGTMNRVAVAGIAAVIVLLGVACASSTSSSPDSTGAADDTPLDGRTFLSESVTEDGQPRLMAGDQPIRLTFADGRITANPGCNSMGGSYSLDVDRLIVAELATTEMACADVALMDQDTWFADLLTAGPTLALAGDSLTMTSGSTIIVFVDRETADPDRPLIGTTWMLESIIEGESASSVPAGVRADLTFTADERLSASLGCNRGSASAIVDDTSVEIGPLAATRMACGEAETAVEDAMIATLTGTVDYEIEGPQLRLRTGDRGLDFRAG